MSVLLSVIGFSSRMCHQIRVVVARVHDLSFVKKSPYRCDFIYATNRTDRISTLYAGLDVSMQDRDMCFVDMGNNELNVRFSECIGE